MMTPGTPWPTWLTDWRRDVDAISLHEVRAAAEEALGAHVDLDDTAALLVAVTYTEE